MPPKSLQGRTCSVSCDGERARALQRNRSRSSARLRHPLWSLGSEAQRRRDIPPLGCSQLPGASRMRCPHRSRGHAVNPSMDAPWQHPCGHRVPQAMRTPHQHVGRSLVENPTHRSSSLVLARLPSRDLWRHGCRQRAYMVVLAACPAMVGGQGPCSQAAALSLRDWNTHCVFKLFGACKTTTAHNAAIFTQGAIVNVTNACSIDRPRVAAMM